METLVFETIKLFSKKAFSFILAYVVEKLTNELNKIAYVKLKEKFLQHNFSFFFFGKLSSVGRNTHIYFGEKEA